MLAWTKQINTEGNAEKSVKAVLKNMRKMFMLQAPVDSECFKLHLKYYFMKFDKGLDSSKLFESLAKGQFSEKNANLPIKTVSAKALNVIFFQYWIQFSVL